MLADYLRECSMYGIPTHNETAHPVLQVSNEAFVSRGRLTLSTAAQHRSKVWADFKDPPTAFHDEETGPRRQALPYEGIIASDGGSEPVGDGSTQTTTTGLAIVHLNEGCFDDIPTVKERRRIRLPSKLGSRCTGVSEAETLGCLLALQTRWKVRREGAHLLLRAWIRQCEDDSRLGDGIGTIPKEASYIIMSFIQNEDAWQAFRLALCLVIDRSATRTLVGSCEEPIAATNTEGRRRLRSSCANLEAEINTAMDNLRNIPRTILPTRCKVANPTTQTANMRRDIRNWNQGTTTVVAVCEPGGSALVDIYSHQLETPSIELAPNERN
jgi:hypothetical protein